jgi:phi13 family phage major tail protein
MNTRKPMIKETVGALYYAFNTPHTLTGEFNAATYATTIKTEVVKNIGTTENAETTAVRASGTDYSTVSKTSSVDLAVEVVAFHVDDLATMRGENVDDGGLISSGRPSTRPFFAFGKVVKKVGGGLRYEWYPKCQLVENTDDIATSEDTFNEQNDTLTIRAYSFNDDKDFKNYVDSEATNYPEGLTEENFFTKPIITKEDLESIIDEYA